jgi:transposase
MRALRIGSVRMVQSEPATIHGKGLLVIWDALLRLRTKSSVGVLGFVRHRAWAYCLHQQTLADVTNVLVDGAYTGERFARLVWQILDAKVEVVKRSELHQFAVIPKRWMVERSFAWLEKCRRLWKNCERKLETSLQFVVLAFLALLLRRH